MKQQHKTRTFQSKLILFVGLTLTYISSISAIENYALYKEDINKMPALEKGMSRLVFYGTNYGWYGLVAGGAWTPKITINEQAINAPNERNIYFAFDVPAGKHKISPLYSNYDFKKPTYRLPYYYKFTQDYTLNAKSGETYYHEMTISLAKTTSIYDFSYILSLWRVDANSAQPMLERMTHWREAVQEAQENNEDEE